MNRLTSRFGVFALLAATSIAYGLIVLWYVPTQPTVPLGCLMVNSFSSRSPGLEIRSVPDTHFCSGYIPEVGDHIVELGGQPIRSYTDWARVHRQWRSLEIGTDGRIEQGQDPSEERNNGNLAAVEYPNRTRLVKCVFIRAGDKKPLESWIELVPQSITGVSLGLIWFVLQIFIVVIGGVAYWHRPFDQPVRTFFVLSSLTICAFLGGSHWWVIASDPTLVTIFAVSGAFLPAVLLHFFVVYPYPRWLYRRSRPMTLVLIYGFPSIAAAALTTLIVASWVLTQDFGLGPFAVTLERILANLTIHSMRGTRNIAYATLGYAMIYFLICVALLIRASVSTRNPAERSQVKSILGAAIFASIPILYTTYLFFFDPVSFALGSARLPMFLASLAFMLAYAVGIARYKLLLVDQVISRGVWYYGSSVGLALLFSAFIAIGAVTALHQDLSIHGHTFPLVLVLTTSILILSWSRDAVQRVLDRHFFSEKYQFDKALGRINRVVAGTLEPEAVSEGLLESCRDVLHVGEAALYLRKRDQSEFRMLIGSGRSNFPVRATLNEEMLIALQLNRVWQRIPHSESPVQILIRQLGAEVIHGLETQGVLTGILVLGAKPAHKSYSAEDVAYVTAIARVASIALHCATTVQQDVSRLKQDVQIKTDKISDQERQIALLQNELSLLTSGKSPNSEIADFQRAGIIGHGAAMQQILETVRKVAASESSVFIRGESGTGKELLARAVHENSPRRNGPLISLHCAALSPTLLESELFGHVKGAFTDAREDKQGRFQMADGGTLFLDEIGDISLDVQIKLLRVLQERTFEPVGGTKSIKVDVRLVAATHRNIEQLIATGEFREDLFYRLNVISLTLPPLRERKEDLFELARHFLRTAAEKANKQVIGFDDEVIKAFSEYDWPGNIRELQNAVERAIVLADDGVVHVSDLPVEITTGAAHSRLLVTSGKNLERHVTATSLARKTPSPKASEEENLRDALAVCDGNKAEAARMLGLPRSTFFSKLKKYHIN